MDDAKQAAIYIKDTTRRLSTCAADCAKEATQAFKESAAVQNVSKFTKEATESLVTNVQETAKGIGEATRNVFVETSETVTLKAREHSERATSAIKERITEVSEKAHITRYVIEEKTLEVAKSVGEAVKSKTMGAAEVIGEKTEEQLTKLLTTLKEGRNEETKKTD